MPLLFTPSSSSRDKSSLVVCSTWKYGKSRRAKAFSQQSFQSLSCSTEGAFKRKTSLKVVISMMQVSSKKKNRHRLNENMESGTDVGLRVS
mmetsp:Transcript_10063/g.24798  ORF Transcript_10063/g.24798 Transcript_10063/m.24798 type:complete len:91 (+) Transcript_10063:383-655(+)